MKKILILILFVSGFVFGQTDSTKKLSSVPVATTASASDYYYIWTGAANKKITLANVKTGLKSLYFDTTYARLHAANTFTGLNTFNGGIAGNGSGLNLAANSSILALKDSLIVHNNNFTLLDTRITQDAENISLVSTSVFGGVFWGQEETNWEDYTSKWDSLYPGLKTAMLDSLLVHRSLIQVNADSILLKVSTSDYTGAEIASKINISSSSIKIQSPHIEFDGAAIFKAINGNNYDSTSIIGDVIKTGIIKSNNYSLTKGSWFNLDLGTIRLGGATTARFFIDSLGYMTAKYGKLASVFFDSTKLYVGAGVFANSNTQFYAGSKGISLTENFSVDSTGLAILRNAKIGTATNYWSVGATGLTATSASTDVIINYGKTDFGQDATNGFILGYDYSASKPKVEFGSGSTKYFKYDGTDLSLIGGTITGGVLQTSASANTGIKINSTAFAAYNGTSQTVNIANDGSGWFGLTGTRAIQWSAGGSVSISGFHADGTNLYTGSKTMYNDANSGVHVGADGIGIADNMFTVSAAGNVNIASGSIGLGATSYSAGNGTWLSSTATTKFRVGNASASRIQFDDTNLEIYNSSNTKVASFGASNTISGLDISSLSIAGNLTMGASGKIWINNAGVGANGYVIDVNGIRGYSSTLGTVFNLPTDGSAPTFSSGIINLATFNLYTSSVIRTSATVGDGSANSAGILMNDTGIYGVGANQLTANANFKLIAATGAISAKLGTIGGWSINSTSIYTGTEDHSAYTSNAGDLTIYSDGSDASIHAKNFYIDAAGSITATNATLSGAITATSGTIGSFNIGTYLYTGSKTAYNDANAGIHLGSDGIGIGNNVFTVSAAGALVATSATITGAIQSGSTITGTTITGGTIQTATSEQRIVINESGHVNTMRFYSATGLAGTISGGTYLSYDYITMTNLNIGNVVRVKGDGESHFGSGVNVGLSDHLTINEAGQLTKINNLAASSYTYRVLASDGTSYTPVALTTAHLPLSSDFAWTGTHTATKTANSSYYYTVDNQSNGTDAISGFYAKSYQGGSQAGVAIQAFNSNYSDAGYAGYGRITADASLNGLIVNAGSNKEITFRINNLEYAKVTSDGLTVGALTFSSANNTAPSNTTTPVAWKTIVTSGGTYKVPLYQ